MTKKEKNGKLTITILSGIFALYSAYQATNTAMLWLDDAISFVAFGGNPILMNNVLMCVLGAIIGIAPWANVVETPGFARILVGGYGAIIALIGLTLVGQVVAVAILEPATFAVADGLRMLWATLVLFVIGVASLVVAASRLKPSSPSTVKTD